MGNDSDSASVSYLDFDLEIGLGTGREYPVSVMLSPAGEAHETMRFPFDKLALESRLDKLQLALLRSGGNRRQFLTQEETAVQDFGSQLFDALIVGEVRSRYDISHREATRQGKGLRLRLRISSPELAALPWEFLYDSRQAEYLCLSTKTPIVRYYELPHPIQPLVITPPLRVLGMIVSPTDLPTLDVEREKQRVENAIKDLQARGMVEVTWLTGQTWRDLQRAMRIGTWHIFHFIGHGGFDHQSSEGMLAFADDEGKTAQLTATQLGRLLADHPSLRLVLLNSCEGARGSEQDLFSSTASILVRRGIPAVLAMQYEISDRAAIGFARAFYEAIADGFPVDAAVAESRKAVTMEVTNTIEWGTPVLFTRAPNGVLFQLQRKRKSREQSKQESVEREKEEQERIAREKARQELFIREKLDQEKITQEKAEQERVTREKAQLERAVQEKAEQERLEGEKTERERIAHEKVGKEHIAREQAKKEHFARQEEEQEKIAQEKAKQERIASEKDKQERSTAKGSELKLEKTTGIEITCEKSYLAYIPGLYKVKVLIESENGRINLDLKLGETKFVNLQPDIPYHLNVSLAISFTDRGQEGKAHMTFTLVKSEFVKLLYTAPLISGGSGRIILKDKYIQK